MIGLLDGPMKPQIILSTLNEQFLSVVDSDRLEQVADVSSLREQSPQLETIRYCTSEQFGSICSQLNLSFLGLTSVRLIPPGAC